MRLEKKYSLRHVKHVVASPHPQFISTFTKKKTYYIFIVSILGLKLDFKYAIFSIDRRLRQWPASVTRTPAYRGCARPHSIFLDVHEFSHSLFKDTHDLKDASITDAHELADTGRGGMTWRPAVLLAVHPPAAPVLLSLFSPASAAPSPSAAEEEVPHRVWALPHHRARGLVARPEEAAPAAPGLAVAARFPALPLRQLRPAPMSSPIPRRAGRHSTGAPSR
jgi:hypothetical protein